MENPIPRNFKFIKKPDIHSKPRNQRPAIAHICQIENNLHTIDLLIH